jgi:hypothetical protein
MNVLFAFVVGAMLHLVPTVFPLPEQWECPAPNPRAQSRVVNFLSLPELAEFRKVADLGSASASTVRAVAGEGDEEACAALRRAIASSGRPSSPGEQLAFYRSGDRYFVPITPPRPTDRIRLGEHSVIEVYDMRYQFVARFSA